MADIVLDVENLGVDFVTRQSSVRAVDGFSLRVRRGETVGIVGESGSGKSVSSLAVMGLLPTPPAKVDGASRIMVGGRDITGFREAQWRALRGPVMAMIFQDPMTCLNPYLRVDRQLTEGMRLHLKLSRREADKKARALLDLVRVPDVGRCLRGWPHELSGGMRQRVMIAMALACDPRLVFADEPTTALDVTVQAQILELFDRLRQQFQTGLIMISHDLGLIATCSDFIVVMYAGQVMEQGRPEDLFVRGGHPYTRALRDSIPDLDGEKTRRLPTIRGLPPDAGGAQQGCAFVERCPEALDRCRQGTVPLTRVSPDHWVRCYLVQE